jgi:hypothetical protein
MTRETVFLKELYAVQKIKFAVLEGRRFAREQSSTEMSQQRERFQHEETVALNSVENIFEGRF